jgi:DNA (cytosine-5)-methyltransferase 1
MEQKQQVSFAKLRERAGLSVAEAAAMLKVSTSQIYRYERGDARPSPLAMELLAQALQRGVAPDFRFVDLFAGIGGLRLGFESIGGRCVFTSEWDTKCNETFRLNFE